jgi:hypothetical protein
MSQQHNSANLSQQISDSLFEDDQLSDEQLEAVSGGIIMSSGQSFARFSRSDLIALNPQPLPPKELFFNFF